LAGASVTKPMRLRPAFWIIAILTRLFSTATLSFEQRDRVN
jgi:hypothetical protein